MTGYFPTGATRLFPVVGDPIAQVKSPRILTGILVKRGEDAVVVPMQVTPTDLTGLLDSLKDVHNVDGILVTVPHKRDAYALCSTRTDRADFVEAVNVLSRTDDGWHGDNTDGIGYLDGIERKGFSIQGRRALLVGCGGAGSAIALEILKRGAAELAIHDIDTARRDGMIAKLRNIFPGRVVAGDTDPACFDLVANATPLGMKPGDPLPIDVSRLRPSQFVACVITKPEVPPLIAEARQRGCRTMIGTDMFAAQAETLVNFLLGRWREGGIVE
ncbi:shikimate dehydrogenase [Agrobacterium sp. CCNWLW71]|uniref:shikimate dehydrogenase family protein n=1 Tax=unclassified Agrobacterium TaxID=2632611 RepID=UPI002FF29F1B